MSDLTIEEEAAELPRPAEFIGGAWNGEIINDFPTVNVALVATVEDRICYQTTYRRSDKLGRHNRVRYIHVRTEVIAVEAPEL